MGGDRGNGIGWSDPMDDDRLPEVFAGRLPEFFPATSPAIFFASLSDSPGANLRLDGRALMGSVDRPRVSRGFDGFVHFPSGTIRRHDGSN